MTSRSEEIYHFSRHLIHYLIVKKSFSLQIYRFRRCQRIHDTFNTPCIDQSQPIHPLTNIFFETTLFLFRLTQLLLDTFKSTQELTATENLSLGQL